jgi:uncharacterized protein (DUF1499 family)
MRWHHDVTTDPATPPPFVALRTARLACRNGVVYSGLHPDEHRAHYPELRTAVFAQTPNMIFEAAMHAANALKWKIAAAVEAEGRIEATATTPLLQFKDDVVIRITPSGDSTTLDIRSASRVGQSDLGTNGKRIRAFVRELYNHLKIST